MRYFFDFVDGNNRIRNAMLSKYTLEKSAFNFVYDVPFPFLIGKQLLEGDLFEQSLKGMNATCLFQADEVPESLNSSNESAITRAIYMVRKNQFLEEPPIEDGEDPNAITLGRSSNNDITINDYAISKKHASITYKNGEYLIEDTGSTNGVSINGRKLEFGEKAVLFPKATVNFGRFSFLFVHPLEIYYRILASQKDGIPLKDDLMKIARECDISTLRHIADLKKCPLSIKPTKLEILNYMSSTLTENQIIDWLYLAPLQ